MSWVECFAPQRFAFRISLSDRFLHRPLHRPRAVHRGAAQEGKPRSAFGLAVRILEYKSPCSALESYPGGYFVPLKKKKKSSLGFTEPTSPVEPSSLCSSSSTHGTPSSTSISPSRGGCRRTRTCVRVDPRAYVTILGEHMWEMIATHPHGGC